MKKSCETGVPYHPTGDHLPRAGDPVEPKNLCAYNKTRGYILGVEVGCGDFSLASLADRMPLLTAKSGAGLWMAPFRGIPATDVRVPLDLIYLDANCQVIETVEFFPTYRVSPSSPPAASLLALPVHAVFASHTQPGDQVAFGHIEEIERELAKLFGPVASASTVEDALGARVEPPKSADPAPRQEPAQTQENDRPRNEEPVSQPPAQAPPAAPWKKETAKPKSWLQRLLSPDPPEPRKSLREALPGLIAYFWTGSSPQAHDIRDISSTGLYVITEERWYPGTLIQITLKKTAQGETKAEFSISLLARANRWGNDGVGLSFVVRDPRKPRDPDADNNGAIDREVLDRFLERIMPGNS